MTEPFQDREIVGTEPLYYTYRKENGYITRYCAMVGMNLIRAEADKVKSDWDRSTETFKTT